MNKIDNLGKILVSIIFVTLFAVILSFTFLKNSSLLIYFYTIAFAFQLISFLIIFYRKKIKIKRNSFFFLGFYLLVLIMPVILDPFLGVASNSYDLLSMVFRIFNFFILFCIIDNLKLEKKQFKYFFKWMIIIGVISCLYNFIFCFSDIAKIISATSSYQVDVKSFFVNRNMFGEFMSISILSTLYYFEGKKSKLKLFLILLFSVNAFITFSRSSIVSVFILLAYMFILKYRKSKKMVIFIFLSVIIGSVFLSGRILDFLETFVIRSDNFSTGRNVVWNYGLNIFKVNPVNGVGYYTAIDLAQSMGTTHTQFHSFFIDSLAGYGLMGLAFNLYILFYGIKKCLKSGCNSYYKHCLIASFIAIFIKMFIESVSFFSVGYSDLVTTIFYISLPLLFANSSNEINEIE